MDHILNTVSGFVWGPVTIILLVGTGVFVALITLGIQVRKFALDSELNHFSDRLLSLQHQMKGIT